MTTPSYLYTFLITALCIVILLGYLFVTAMSRQKKYLLMVGLYAVYLLSELARILAMLSEDASKPTNVSAIAVIAATMLVFYFLIMWQESGKKLHPVELFLLMLSVVANLCLLEIPEMKAFASRSGFYIFIWGGWKLWSVRRKSPRTYMMFWLATGIAIFHIVINLLDPLLCLDVLFSVAGSFALTTVAFELMFYVIILASAAELFCFFRGAIAGGNANEKTQNTLENPLPNASISEMVERCGLTPREKDVFLLLAEGRSAREIAEMLFISEGTVKVHTHNLDQKLGISKRSQIYQMVLDIAVGGGQEIR